MKKETVAILRNFSSINQGIIFRQGNELRTMSIMKNVFASAKVPDDFDQEFAIYDLNEFLSTLSLFDAPTITYQPDHIDVRSGKNRAKYFFSSPSVIVSPPVGKSIPVNPYLTFKITSGQLEAIQKAAAVLKLKELEITSTGIRAFNKAQSGNQYDIEVDDIQGTGKDQVLLIENLKLLPLDYTVDVADRVVRFTSVSGDLEYIISVETD